MSSMKIQSFGHEDHRGKTHVADVFNVREKRENNKKITLQGKNRHERIKRKI